MTVSVQHPFDYILEPSKVNDGRVYWKCSGINGLYINWAGTQHFLITKTYLYKFDPLKPHSYAVKLGFTGVYIIFLISAQNIDCGYPLEPPRRGGSNEYPQSMFFLAEIRKISDIFIWKFSFFGGKIFSVFE